MADWKMPAAVVACSVLLLGQCQKDPITGAKVATGAAVAGVGVGAGAVGASAAGAAAKGASKGIEARARDRVARGKPRPNGPSRPYSPTTTTAPVPQFEDGLVIRP